MALPVILGHLSAALSGREECSLGTGFVGSTPSPDTAQINLIRTVAATCESSNCGSYHLLRGIMVLMCFTCIIAFNSHINSIM